MSPMPRVLVFCLLILVLANCSCGAMTNSKLGLHTSLGSNSWNIINNSKMRVLKLLDSFGSAPQLKSSNPGMVIVGRIYLDNQPTGGDPNAAASNWWSVVGNTISNSPGVDFWEGYNEPSVSQLSDMQWYASFEAARVKLLAQHGFKAAVGCFAVGTPDVTSSSMMQAMYPMIDAALQNGGILALHEYNAPVMNDTFSGDTHSGSGWYVGRYRKMYDQYLLPSGRKIPLVMTEAGIDAGLCSANGCHESNGGWKLFCSQWGGNCNQQYLAQLAWYDQVMRADDFVIGATIFCIDIPGWDSFDIGQMSSNMISYLNSQ